MSEGPANWYWSQRGATLGPVDFAELQRLALAGSITRDTFVFDPARSEWVAAGSVEGLLPAGFAGADAGSMPPPPPPPPPTAAAPVFCRACGARNEAIAVRCTACGQELSPRTNGLDPKIAEVVCRASILATPLLAATIIGPAIGPAIVWALGSENPRVVAEAKQAFNCLLTLLIAGAVLGAVGLIGICCIAGPILAAVGYAVLAIYCIVAGIMGLVASSDGKPFSYPFVISLLR